VHVPIPGEPAYGGQGGSGWTTPLLRPEDGGRTQSETRYVTSTSLLAQAYDEQFTPVKLVKEDPTPLSPLCSEEEIGRECRCKSSNPRTR